MHNQKIKTTFVNELKVNYMKELSKDQLELLQKPLPPEALKAHPTKKDSSGTPMTTIKAIYVIDRLNDVFGIGKWQLKTDYISHEKILRMTQAGKERTEYISAVKTIFTVPEYDIHLECIAGSTNDDLGDALKGGTTDGITKIASYLNIGSDIWRGTKQKAPAPAKTATLVVKPTESVKVAEPVKTVMIPSTSFEQPVLPAGFMDELAKVNTWEDLLKLKKKHDIKGDEALRKMVSDKMNMHFRTLPKEEQVKAKSDK